MKYNKELIQIILDKEKLSSILNKASEILDIFNQSNELEPIKIELTKPEHYSILRQLADISDYFAEVGDSVVVDFVDKAIGQLDLSKKITPLEIKFIAIQLMAHLYHNNKDLYEFFSQKKSNSNKVSSTVDVIYEPKFDEKTASSRYQFSFDSQNNTWQVQRFAPELSEAEIITDWYVLKTMEIVLANIRPETLNPFLKNALNSCLENYENSHQRKKQAKLIKQTFTNQAKELTPLIKQFCDDDFLNTDLVDKIDILHRSFFNNAQSKPQLMSALLLEEGIFELKNKFTLISFLANYAEWTGIEKLLEKESIKRSLLDGDFFDFHTLQKSKKDLSTLSKFIFKEASQEQLKNLDVNSLTEWVLALSGEDLIKYMNEGKIKLEYPQYSYFIEELYKTYLVQFPTILEMMLASGKIINDIPREKEIQTCYMNLFLKHNGEWLNLISHKKGDIYNHKADLLMLAIREAPEKTLAIIKAHSLENSDGKSFFPVDLKAEEIANLIKQAPKQACVLLDYANILDTLKNDTVSYEPYGELRQFDVLFNILRAVPANYIEKLLRSGILFPEKGMPHFQHLSGLGNFGGKNASGYINNILDLVYQKLDCSIFMAALTEGLEHNQNVNRLFLNEVFAINLIELANVLSLFQNIKHLEIALSLKKENQDNIINFFKTLSQTNPHLNYHIKVKLTSDNEQFQFLTNYLSQSTDQIISLTIIPEDFWISAKLLDKEDPSFKNFFDNCIKEICQNNSILRKTSINGFSESLFGRRNKGSSYHFDEFPNYNTHLLAMNNTDPMSAEEEIGPKNLLKRNRSLQALKVLSTKISSFQNILEILPWLELSNLPVEAIVEIFEHLKYQHRLPTTIPPYQKILDGMQKLQESKPLEGKKCSLEGIEHGLKKAEGFLTATTMKAYYRYKPHKEDIQMLERFLAMDQVQERVVKAISDWFNAEERPKLPEILNLIKMLNSKLAITTSSDKKIKYIGLRSASSLINELDGIPTQNDKASEHFCEVLNTLHYYQKAISRCTTSLRREPYVVLQSKAPLNNSLAWNDLAAQSFDGIELLEVLKDTSFTNFSDKESTLFNEITKALTLYLKQKDKPKNLQCDKHKHLHKNELFNLLRPESLTIFKDSNPRLYQILLLQRERLANSISKCSVKLQLRLFGLFSIQHEKKQLHDATIISDFKGQIESRCLSEPAKQHQEEFENSDEGCLVM
jgi:hypothetical protein